MAAASDLDIRLKEGFEPIVLEGNNTDSDDQQQQQQFEKIMEALFVAWPRMIIEGFFDVMKDIVLYLHDKKCVFVQIIHLSV